MKLDVKNLNTETSGEVETANLTIKADAFMFDTLFSGIYKNPMEASIREIISNAYDSHNDANKKQPFDVKLPTRLDPKFSCRDYGEGMSHTFVMRLYTQAGFSNKRNTNELVGGYGLGSKAPFSYTNNFTVVSIHNGLKSIYNVYKQNDGLPTISCFDSFSTDEPSGVEVYFSVKKNDIDEFNKIAKYLFLGFVGLEIQPRNVRTKEPFLNCDILYEDEKGLMIKNDEFYKFYKQNDSFIRMGCVLYPAAYDFIKDSFDFRKNIKILKCNIGDYKITRSRDSIVTNEGTFKKLSAEFTQFAQSYTESILKSFENCDDFLCILKRGIDLDKKSFVKENLREILWEKNINFNLNIKAAYTPSYSNKVKTKAEKISNINLFHEPVKIIIGNSKTLIPSRVKLIRETKAYRHNIIYLECEQDVDSEFLYLLKEYFDVYYTQDFTPEKKVVKQNKKNTKEVICEKNSGVLKPIPTKKIDENTNEECYFVLKENGKVKFFDEYYTYNNFRDFMYFSQEKFSHSFLKKLDKDIVLATKTKLEKNSNLISLETVFRNYIHKNAKYFSFQVYLTENIKERSRVLNVPDFSIKHLVFLQKDVKTALENIFQFKKLTKYPYSILRKEFDICSSHDMMNDVEIVENNIPLIRLFSHMEEKEIHDYLKTIGVIQ